MPVMAQCWRTGTTGRFRTAPRLFVQFLGGFAYLGDGPGMVWALRDPACTVTPVAPYIEQLTQWLQQCGVHQPPQARIVMPEGWELGEPPDYPVRRTGLLGESLAVEVEPEVVEDPLGTPEWEGPAEAVLAAPEPAPVPKRKTQPKKTPAEWAAHQAPGNEGRRKTWSPARRQAQRDTAHLRDAKGHFIPART